MRLLDEVLKLAKLRSSDPKKYLPIAVNMLKDRLKQSNSTRTQKQGVRFTHTLETIFTATDDEPELITAFLKNKQEKNTKPSLATASDSFVQKLTEKTHEQSEIPPVKSVTMTEISMVPEEILDIDSHRQAIPVAGEADIPASIAPVTSNELVPRPILSTPVISQIGLSVAQMIVLTNIQSQKPLKLTTSQIKR